MRMWQQFDMISLLDTLASLLLAFVLGSLVGLERQYRQRTAGLRTNVLVAVGAALFVNLAQRIYDLHGGTYGVVHVVAYIVSGIGFLGAGVIMRESGNIRGINTAATLWGVAAVGAASGPGWPWRRSSAPCSCWPPTPCCARWSTRSTGVRWTTPTPR